MKKTKFLILLIGMFLINQPCFGQNSPINGVGFKTLNLYDYSQKNPKNPSAPLPLQLSIWYPSREDGEKMKFRDYEVSTQNGSEEITELTPDYIEKRISDFKKIRLGLGASEENLNLVLDYNMEAKFNGKPIKNKSPVILLLGCTQASYWAVTAEELTKNGFVVVAIPIMQFPIDEIAVVRLAINKLQTETYADISQIGVVGYSMGGVDAILYQMSNTNVKAVMTLEGSELRDPYIRLFSQQAFKKHSLYNLNNANVPYCALYSARGSYGRLSPYSTDFSFYDDIITNNFLVEVANLHHEGVTGFGFFTKIEPKLISSDTTFNNYKDFEIVSHAITSFFNEFLKEDVDDADNKLITISNKFGKNEVIVKPFTEGKIIKNGQSLLHLNLTEEALAVLNLGLTYYPQSTNINLVIAECYLKSKNHEKANKVLQELLRIDNLKDKISNLKKKYHVTITGYEEIKIGNQIWMKHNLNYTNENFHTFCYKNKPGNCEEFGAIYTWAEANKVCPKGWRIPTRADVFELFEHLPGETNLNNGRVIDKETLDKLNVKLSGSYNGKSFVAKGIQEIWLTSTDYTYPGKTDPVYKQRAIHFYPAGKGKYNVEPTFTTTPSETFYGNCRCIKNNTDL